MNGTGNSSGDGLTMSILGPDFQGLVSKVFWTSLQAFGGVFIGVQFADLDLDVVNMAIVAGASAAWVPVTTYARMMVGQGVVARSNQLGEPVEEYRPPAGGQWND